MWKLEKHKQGEEWEIVKEFEFYREAHPEYERLSEQHPMARYRLRNNQY